MGAHGIGGTGIAYRPQQVMFARVLVFMNMAPVRNIFVDTGGGGRGVPSRYHFVSFQVSGASENSFSVRTRAEPESVPCA